MIFQTTLAASSHSQSKCSSGPQEKVNWLEHCPEVFWIIYIYRKAKDGTCTFVVINSMKTTPEIIEDIKSTVVQYFVAKASDLSGYKVNKEKIEVVVAKVGRCL